MRSVRSTDSTIVVFSLNHEHLFIPAPTSDEASSADAPPSNHQHTFNNKKILDSLLSRIDRETPPAKIILMNASSEQSYHDNDGSPIRNFYDFYQRFCGAIEKTGLATGCEFNGCALADVYGQKKPGENCERALRGDRTYLFDGHVPDLSNFLPWYMRMHTIAMLYKTCRIIFHEYDHTSTGLAKFLTKHPYFIPINATVQFHHYLKTPQHTVEITEVLDLIQGTGNIDESYGLTIQYITSCMAWFRKKDLPPHDKPWSKKDMQNVILHATTYLALSDLRPVAEYLKKRATSNIRAGAEEETVATEAASAANTAAQSIEAASAEEHPSKNVKIVAPSPNAYPLHSNTSGFMRKANASNTAARGRGARVSLRTTPNIGSGSSY